jgi:hypothetical protein
MPDKDFILKRNPFANERVRRYLAARPDYHLLLNLDKWADPGFSANSTAVEIHQLRVENLDMIGKANIVSDRHGLLQNTKPRSLV